MSIDWSWKNKAEFLKTWKHDFGKYERGLSHKVHPIYSFSSYNR